MYNKEILQKKVASVGNPYHNIFPHLSSPYPVHNTNYIFLVTDSRENIILASIYILATIYN